MTEQEAAEFLRSYFGPNWNLSDIAHTVILFSEYKGVMARYVREVRDLRSFREEVLGEWGVPS